MLHTRPFNYIKFLVNSYSENSPLINRPLLRFRHLSTRMNHDERPLMKGEFTVNREGDSPFVDRNFVRKLLCWCCHGSDEIPSWDEKLKGSVRRGRNLSDSIANEVALNWSRKEKKLKVFFRRLGKSNRKSVYCNISTKSGRFQYDRGSYALNFEEGSLDEDEHSMLTFSARFAAPVAKPWETLQSSNVR